MFGISWRAASTHPRSLILRAIAIALLNIPLATTANGAGPQLPALEVGINQLRVPVTMARCARLITNSGREVIYNSCGVCRVVSISRKRNGIAIPVTRTYNVRPRNKFPLPFRGPGRSRITNEQACEGDKGSAQNLVNPTKRNLQAEKQCVELKQTSSGSVVLVNACAACRGTAIQRQDLRGKPMGMQAYKLGPQSVTPVARKGAAKVSLIGEVACTL
ncbi:MAG: hypothetical protein VX990_04345 [Pseudomonadota bacterium]|nr:hypothetical protein [Pseudomonadota bacterium]